MLLLLSGGTGPPSSAERTAPPRRAQPAAGQPALRGSPTSANFLQSPVQLAGPNSEIKSLNDGHSSRCPASVQILPRRHEELRAAAEFSKAEAW